MGKITDWLVDYLYMFKGFTLTLVYRRPPKHYLEHVAQNKIPIIMIPGVGSRWQFLKPLADYLSLVGHPIYIVPELKSNIASIPTASKIVRELINTKQISNLVIIGHSKGGLIGKYLLAYHNQDRIIKGLIAITTPFSGSNISQILPFKPIQELNSSSEVIRDLAAHPEVNNKIISLIVEYDNHVWHPQGSVLTGALDNVYLSNHGHHQLLWDKKVWQQIAESIDRLSAKGI